MEKNLTFLLLVLAAEIIGTVGGFGSSVFFVPVAGFFLNFHSVLGLTALLHVASNISKLALFKNGLNRKLIVNIGIPSVLFTIAGGLLSRLLDAAILKVILAIFLVCFSLVFLVRKGLIIVPNKTNSWLGGAFSGFSAGLLGTGGAIRGLTMASFNLEKSNFIATSAFIDLFIDLTRTAVYFENGFIKKEEIGYIPAFLFIAIAGSYIGKKILQKIPQENFRRFSLWLIFLVGILMLVELAV